MVFWAVVDAQILRELVKGPLNEVLYAVDRLCPPSRYRK